MAGVVPAVHATGLTPISWPRPGRQRLPWQSRGRFRPRPRALSSRGPSFRFSRPCSNSLLPSGSREFEFPAVFSSSRSMSLRKRLCALVFSPLRRGSPQPGFPVSRDLQKSAGNRTERVGARSYRISIPLGASGDRTVLSRAWPPARSRPSPGPRGRRSAPRGRRPRPPGRRRCGSGSPSTCRGGRRPRSRLRRSRAAAAR